MVMKGFEEANTRLSINIAPDVAEALQQAAQQRNTTLTNTVARAISLLKYVDEVRARGANILVEEPDGRIYQIEFS